MNYIFVTYLCTTSSVHETKNFSLIPHVHWVVKSLGTNFITRLSPERLARAHLTVGITSQNSEAAFIKLGFGL